MIEQRTPEWFEARKKRLTGSMVGAVLGLAPYMTRAAAMRSMVREAIGAPREFSGNVATEYGTNNEAGALIEFQLEIGLGVTPAPFVPYEDWLGASPDGYTSDGGLVEIKCPYGKRKDDNPEFLPASDQPHYMAQMQIQMLVTGLAHCHFYQWAMGGTRWEIVGFDQAWIDRNLPILRQFYAEFLDEVENNAAEHLAPLRAIIDTPEAHRMVAEWDQLNEALERTAERKKDLLAAMVALAGETNAEIAGRKLTLTERAGSIAYGKAIKALLPKADLTPYTGKPVSYWSLK